MLCRVKDGTGAGKRRERVVPKHQWTCSHGHVNPGYAARCLTSSCLERRPA